MKNRIIKLSAIAACALALVGSACATMSPPSNIIGGTPIIPTTNFVANTIPSAPLLLTASPITNGLVVSFVQSTNQAPVAGIYVRQLTTLTNALPPATTNNFIMIATIPPSQFTPGATSFFTNNLTVGGVNYYYYFQAFNNSTN